LNPGPHGPEPSWLRVLYCPGGSPDARLNSNCHTFVSVRVLLEPPGFGNLCPGCAPVPSARWSRVPDLCRQRLGEFSLVLRPSSDDTSQNANADFHRPPETFTQKGSEPKSALLPLRRRGELPRRSACSGQAEESQQ